MTWLPKNPRKFTCQFVAASDRVYKLELWRPSDIVDDEPPAVIVEHQDGTFGDGLGNLFGSLDGLANFYGCVVNGFCSAPVTDELN